MTNNGFDFDNIENYSKKELITFGIQFREQKKQVEDAIKMINLCLMEMHDIDGKERYGDYNVFHRPTTSYALKKGYDYSKLQSERPDLFSPDKAKMYKEFPDAIERRISNTIEISKDKIFTSKK